MKRILKIILLACALIVSCESAYAQMSFKQISGSTTGGAGAATTATLAAPTGGQTDYLEHFTVTCPPVAGAVSGNVAVNGLAAGTLNYTVTETVAGGAVLDINFTEDPEAASATNAAITVVLAAIGSGGACTVTAVGRQY